MIGSILKKLLAERGLSVSEAARHVGVPAQTLYSIVRRDNMKIDFDLLLRLCEYLRVPLSAFSPDLGQSDTPDMADLDHLRRFQVLDGHGKHLTELVMEAEAARMRAETAPPKPAAAKIIPLYYTPAAAGYASPALGEDYEDYEVPIDSKADFAARIEGDSMEPWIPDGSIALVARRTDLRDGDIGLFYVDGDMKCKQYCQDSQGNVYLFSLNRVRRDADVTIPASSGVTIWCFGRVLLDRRVPLPVD